MKLYLRNGIVLGILAALVTSGAAFFSGCASSSEPARMGSGNLVIRDSGSGRIFGKWPLEDQGEFAIEFIHSVNQSQVRDFFQIDGGRIRLVAAHFYSFGAGIQTHLEEGQVLSHEGGALIITGYKASFNKLSYIVGTVSDHLLFINGECISLRNLCGKNAHININFE